MSTFAFRKTVARVPGFLKFSRNFSTEEKAVKKNFAHTDEIVATLAEQTGVHKRDVKAVLSALPNFIRDELDAGNSVRLFRMVTLQRTDTAARTMNHIKTKEKYTMPAMKITRAKVCSFLKK